MKPLIGIVIFLQTLNRLLQNALYVPISEPISRLLIMNVMHKKNCVYRQQIYIKKLFDSQSHYTSPSVIISSTLLLNQASHAVTFQSTSSFVLNTIYELITIKHTYKYEMKYIMIPSYT